MSRRPKFDVGPERGSGPTSMSLLRRLTKSCRLVNELLCLRCQILGLVLADCRAVEFDVFKFGFNRRRQGIGEFKLNSQPRNGDVSRPAVGWA